jgi:hypothetical protein
MNHTNQAVTRPRRAGGLLCLVAGLAVVATACGAKSDTGVFGAEATTGTAPATATTTAVAVGPQAPIGPAAVSPVAPDTSGARLSPDELRSVTDFYLQFVTAADRAQLGDEAAGQALGGLADQGVLDQVDTARRSNEQLRGADAATLQRISTSNPATISGGPDAVVIADCVEAEEDRQVLNLHTVQFIDQLTTLSQSGTGWKVTRLEVRNDGTPGSGQVVGCVTEADRRRLVDSVGTLMRAIDIQWADPGQTPAPELTRHLDGELVTELNSQMQSAQSEGVYATAPAEHTVTVLGTDILAGGRSYVVGVCSSYPQGLTLLSKATGQPAAGEATLEPGAHLYREIAVEAVADPTGGFLDKAYDTRRIDTKSNCGG